MKRTFPTIAAMLGVVFVACVCGCYKRDCNSELTCSTNDLRGKLRRIRPKASSGTIAASS